MRRIKRAFQFFGRMSYTRLGFETPGADRRCGLFVSELLRNRRLSLES